MKKQILFTIPAFLFSLVSYSYDIEVANADGVTIYYEYINDSTELGVTGPGIHSDRYMGKIVIPEEVTYGDKTYKVTDIGNDAFNGCSGLTSITIPNSVTSIGHGAFGGCTGLTSVTIPKSVKYIAVGAFGSCSSLQKVIVPDIAAWCGIEFGYDTSNPLVYAHHLFSDDNTEIKDLVIPNGVTSIGDCAFWGCSGLTSIEIPNSVTNIGTHAFDGCSGLTSITIPNSVTSIEARAFYGVDFLIVISLIENPFNINGINGTTSQRVSTFSKNTFNNATLYVPKVTIDKYKATEGWKDFKKIVEGVPAGINSILLDSNKNIPMYDLNGRPVSNPQKGINIIDGKKVMVK